MQTTIDTRMKKNRTNLENKLGLLIKEHREKRGFTQKDLAKELYLAESTICRWESCERMADLSMMGKICNILDIPQQKLPLVEQGSILQRILDLRFYVQENKYKVSENAMQCLGMYSAANKIDMAQMRAMLDKVLFLFLAENPESVNLEVGLGDLLKYRDDISSWVDRITFTHTVLDMNGQPISKQETYNLERLNTEIELGGGNAEINAKYKSMPESQIYWLDTSLEIDKEWKKDEMWKSNLDYGSLEISNKGRIKNENGIIPQYDEKDYDKATGIFGGYLKLERIAPYVWTLIAETWLEKPNDGQKWTAHHISNDAYNGNTPENLIWLPWWYHSLIITKK